MRLAGGFGNLWRTNAAVRAELGCPADVETASLSVEQIYDTGRMYFRDQGTRFWVFAGTDSGTWREYGDIDGTDPEPSEEPPAGHYKPVSGFGRLWQKYEAVRAALGWPTTPETPFTGVSQPFERGVLLFVPGVNDHGKQIYVMSNDATFQVYADTYVGP